jgi:hypothetical protein
MTADEELLLSVSAQVLWQIPLMGFAAQPVDIPASAPVNGSSSNRGLHSSFLTYEENSGPTTVSTPKPAAATSAVVTDLLSAGGLGSVTVSPSMSLITLPAGLKWLDNSTAALVLPLNESYVTLTLPGGVKAVSLTVLGDLCSDIYTNLIYDIEVTAVLAPFKQSVLSTQQPPSSTLRQYGYVPSCGAATVGVGFGFVTVLSQMDDLLLLNISLPTFDDQGGAVDLVLGPVTLWYRNGSSSSNSSESR